MTCEEFFRLLWPAGVPGRIAIWHGETKLTSYHLTPETAAHAAIRLSNKKQNAYFGVGSRRTGLPGYLRGGAGDVTALPALFADIDVQSPAHPNPTLPPDAGVAFQLAYEMQPRPTLINLTGGGLHVYHVLSSPLVVGDEWPRDRISRLIRLYKDWVVAHFAPYHVDPGTFELSRVLRPPETVRYKANDPPFTVTPMWDDGDKVSVEALLQVLGVPSSEANPETDDIEPPNPTIIDVKIQSKIESLLSHGLAVQFTATWNRRRTEHPEWSQSEYDMAFAAHLANFEWAGSDIARALVIYRLKCKASPKPAKYFSRTASAATALVKNRATTTRDPEVHSGLSLAEISEILGIEIISISRTGELLWIGLASGLNLRIPVDSLGTVEYLRQTLSYQSEGTYSLRAISDAAWTAVAGSIKKVATLL